MDLSRNQLEGIDSLLIVETERIGEESKGRDEKEGAGDGDKEAGSSRRATHVYPLAGLQELRLNGCAGVRFLGMAVYSELYIYTYLSDGCLCNS